MTRWQWRLLVTLALLALWELLFRTGALSPVIFGAPSLIFAAALKDGGTFLAAFRVTAGEMVVAMAIAWIGGVAFGVMIGAAPLPSLIVAPILSGVIALPLIVLYPVLVAWLGIGTLSKIAYGAAAGFFPVALAAVLGIRAIDPRYADMARAVGATPLQMLTQVKVRLALPAIVSGLKVGTSLVIISVIQSEMLSATDGIGFWISYHRSLFNTGHVYLGITLVLVMAVIANTALAALERRLGGVRVLAQAVG
jgi:NitT/TauT family transport system permease protein/taurine transport system permease protein